MMTIGWVTAQKQILKSSRMGYDTPAVIHAPTNVNARLSPQPIRQHGTYRLWVMTHIQPTNRSTRHPSMTGYDYIVDEAQLSYQVSLW